MLPWPFRRILSAGCSGDATDGAGPQHGALLHLFLSTDIVFKSTCLERSSRAKKSCMTLLMPSWIPMSHAGHHQIQFDHCREANITARRTAGADVGGVPIEVDLTGAELQRIRALTFDETPEIRQAIF